MFGSLRVDAAIFRSGFYGILRVESSPLMSRFVFISFAALALPLSARVQQPVPPVEFNGDVRPILSDNLLT